MVTEGIIEDWRNYALLSQSSSAAWSGFTFLVGFVIVFRTSQAYTRFWAALGDTHQMLAGWLEAASSLVAFARSSPKDAIVVENFLHTAVRLFSLLSASALQELTDVAEHHTWGLPTLDASTIDPETIETLDSSNTRVELLYHWLQQLVLDSQQSGVLTTSPPILARTLAELAKGMDKFQDAMKHSKVSFPFPYAQTTTLLLVFHWILTPLVMVQWTEWSLGAGVFTFVQVFTLWCLNGTAVGFEKPFGGEDNDIDPWELQRGMNSKLVTLMEPRTRRTPFIPMSTYVDLDLLKKRDTVHAAALHQEGWELKDVTSHIVEGRIWSCCRKKRSRDEEKSKIAVSTRYCTKRYGVIDGEKTAVLTIGIVGSELFLALPPQHDGKKGNFEVPNVKGERCTMRHKRVPIHQRHSLSQTPDASWEKDDYLDFPDSYLFAAEELAQASDSHKGDKASVQDIAAEQDGEQQLAIPDSGVTGHLGAMAEGHTEADAETEARVSVPGYVDEESWKAALPREVKTELSLESVVHPTRASTVKASMIDDPPSVSEQQAVELEAEPSGGGQVLPWGAAGTSTELTAAAEDTTVDVEAAAAPELPPAAPAPPEMPAAASELQAESKPAGHLPDLELGHAIEETLPAGEELVESSVMALANGGSTPIIARSETANLIHTAQEMLREDTATGDQPGPLT
eukprot:CAMPEP_0197675332 /NCGR_PEP_ID=MMETSP1338-20131121/84734_1 /TAXON_ID=43686 ORGANISM="Pelagodinium beii, Strain RCC1491" /NCGR_SAMPLE_ID=MMETSP1338 /ASSEMBLY_ACC=CAM_ASM_000754 /LENGTH=683 /DNA_ID=CAMNT_0043255867 /DNA_START=164 /DNA_END=2215 /DNA_ORIENTATION=+